MYTVEQAVLDVLAANGPCTMGALVSEAGRQATDSESREVDRARIFKMLDAGTIVYVGLGAYDTP